MKVYILFVFFVLSSSLLLSLALLEHTKPLYLKRMEEIRVSKIQKIIMKEYPKRRDVHPQERTISKSESVIARMLLEKPIVFQKNSDLLESRVVNDRNSSVNLLQINKIVKILNAIEEDVVLTIAVHSDKRGSNRDNLKGSQKRADRLKEYIKERTNLLFIIAIGYGEEISRVKSRKNLSNERIEMKIKRVKK